MQNFYTAPAYIGIKLICGSTTIYGWIKVKNLNLSITPNEMRVESYAINNSNCGTIGIDEYKLNTKSVLFPNPVQNSLNFKLPEELSSVIISISDLTGKMVVSDRIISQNESLNTSQLLPGIYTVKIQIEGFTIHKKLVKE